MGTPEPEVEWYRGADKLYPSERIRIEREGTGLLRLTIIGVDPGLDVGLYRCRIYNPHGEASCEAHMVYDCKLITIGSQQRNVIDINISELS